jgi:hypothetical protein
MTEPSSRPDPQVTVLYYLPGRGLVQEAHLSEAERTALARQARWGRLAFDAAGMAWCGPPFRGGNRGNLLRLARSKAHALARRPFWKQPPAGLFLVLVRAESDLTLT